MTNEETVAWLRRFLPDFYFVNAPFSRMERHVAALQKRTAQTSLIEWLQPQGAGLTELTLCAPDEARPGLLSHIALAFVALKINVHTAWIHTLSDPFDENPNAPRVVLNTFMVSENYFGRPRALSAKTRKNAENVLRAVLQGAPPPSIERRKWGAKKLAAPLQMRDVSATTLGAHTIIKLRAHDNSGVFFRLTAALATLEWNIDHAQINTFEHEVDDVFFVTSKVPIDNAHCIEQLQNALDREAQKLTR